MAISTRRCRDTPHPSTPAVYSPQELLCVFNTPTAVCYLHMFSARQYLLHQELKQDKTDLASSSENKASSINSASKGSKLVFWRDSFELPLFIETKWNKKTIRYTRKMKQGLQLLSSVQTPAPLGAHSKQTTSTLPHSVSQPVIVQKRDWIQRSQLHLFNLFLDVQESINEKLAPPSTSDVSAQRWLQWPLSIN